MPQLINNSHKFRKEDAKVFLMMGNLLDASWCPHCLKRIHDVNKAVYENNVLSCSPECAREYRMERILTRKGGIRTNNDND